VRIEGRLQHASVAWRDRADFHALQVGVHARRHAGDGERIDGDHSVCGVAGGESGGQYRRRPVAHHDRRAPHLQVVDELGEVVDEFVRLVAVSSAGGAVSGQIGDDHGGVRAQVGSGRPATSSRGRTAQPGEVARVVRSGPTRRNSMIRRGRETWVARTGGSVSVIAAPLILPGSDIA
jgi:hypothetical protein